MCDRLREASIPFRAEGASLAHVPDTKNASTQVRTVASAALATPNVDVLIVDEAYQCDSGSVAFAGANATHVVLVGDSGQIGPVVKIEDRTALGVGGLRAPDAFLTIESTARFCLPYTWRFGQETVDIIAPFYDFEFTSKADPCIIENVTIKDLSSPVSLELLDTVHDKVRTLIGNKAGTIGVVATRNEQVGGLAARLGDMAIVGTADGLQGQEFDCVIAVDPFIGANVLSDHALETGRLCVMLSRHRRRLIFVTTSHMRKDMPPVHREVRETIASKSMT